MTGAALEHYWYLADPAGALAAVLALRLWRWQAAWRHIPHAHDGYVAMAGNAWPCRRCGKLPAS
jgi:hypothetical protein